MRAQSLIVLLIVTSVQLSPVRGVAADSDAIGRAYALQATDVARQVVLAQLMQHPERIHRMSMKLTFQIDRQGHPHDVKVFSNTRNRWAEDVARRALAAARFPPLPKSVMQQFRSDLATFDAQLDLDATR
jgi:hypothetical protein